MAADGRIAIVVRPVDRVLGWLRVALVPLVLFAASLPTLKTLAGSPAAPPRHWLFGFAGAVVAAAYVALLQTEMVGSRVDHVIARSRRYLAMACNHDYGIVHLDGRFACRLTPQALRAPLFRYEQQRQVVAALTDACGDGQKGQYWFVEGQSGSGKTRTAMLFVQTLVRDLRLCKCGNRCYLYDFADSDAKQDDLIRRFGTPRHDGAVILVDNFQLVRADVLRELTQQLVHGVGSIPERLLVFLARPADAWNVSAGSEVRLLSEAKKAGHHLVLTGPPSEAVARCVFDFDPVASELVRDLQEDYIASAVQLHLAQVIARNRAVPPDVLATLHLLGDSTGDTLSPELVHLLGIMAALAMHRGAFERRDFRRAIRIAGRDMPPEGRLRHAVRTRTIFRRLNRVGLVPKMHLDRTRYMFHEAIAELCIDRLVHVPAFEAPFAAVGQARLDGRMSGDSPLTAWLVSAEIGAQAGMQAQFDAAVSTGAYSPMAKCLRRASARYELSAPARLELAILLDRVGDFDGSRAQLHDGLVELLGSSPDLAVVLATTRIEATHDRASEAAVEALRDNPDRLVAIIGEYWQLHIAAHRGEFASERLLELATEARRLIEPRESHWLVYSLARMHFDSLRHHYLAGETPSGAIASPERRALCTYLTKRLATFEPLHLLYTKAHLVGHVLLPQVTIFKQPVTTDEAALADIDAAEVTEVRYLVAAAQHLYRRAKDEFWKYGDRETRYLQADILNAEMIQDGVDLETFTVRLHEYESFIDATGFKDIASYPHFYFLRWHMLKYYEILFDDRARDPRTADEHLAEAKRRLRWMVKLDTEVQNQYGLLRSEMLSVLVRGVEEPLVEEELVALERRASDRGYGFERRLLQRLIDKPALSPVELRAILRFYPFVHQ